jgi:hypothetical protein
MGSYRRGSVASGAVLLVSVALGAGPGAIAQESTAQDACVVLTPDEVGPILGGDVFGEGGSDDLTAWCDWWPSDESSVAHASVTWEGGTLAEVIESLGGDGVELTIGGYPAFYSAIFRQLVIGLDDGVLALTLELEDPDADLRPGLSSLGELAVGRAASLPDVASIDEGDDGSPDGSVTDTGEEDGAGPPADFARDAELEGMFPRTVGGSPVTAVAAIGADAFAQGFPPELVARFEDALAEQGKTIADVSLGYGPTASLTQPIIAFRVAGGDASALASLYLEWAAEQFGFEFERSDGQVAGRDVTLYATDFSTTYLYPNGDVTWIVSAADPFLTEIFEQLP